MFHGLSESTANAAVLFLFVAIVAGLTLWSRARAPGLESRIISFAVSRSCWVPACVTILAGLGVLLVVNVSYPAYLDHAEPTIASLSWLVLKGAPLYHPIDAAARYSLLYGPATYLPYAGGLGLVASTAALKSVVLGANVVMLYFVWRSYRTLLDPMPALFATVVLLLFLLVPRPNDYLFQVRADVLVLAAVAVALFGASRPAGRLGPIAFTLGAAFVIDAKATGFFYLLPLFAIFYRSRGLRLAALVALAASVVALLPFLLPNVSARSYVEWVRRATGHPRAMSDLLSTLRTLPLLALPFLLLLGPTPWRNPNFLAYGRARWLTLHAFAFTLAFAIMASTRIGAGSHHLLPVLPVLGYEAIVLYRALEGGDFARRHASVFNYVFACSALFVLVRVGGGLVQILEPWSDWQHAVSVRDEVRALIRQYGPHLAIGYGDRLDYSTSFRPEAVFAGGDVLVDEVALSDMDMDGIPFPAATVEALNACLVKVWLLPKGEEPFAMESTFAQFYPQLVASRPLFGPAFRAMFARRYSKNETTASFDVWVCKDRAELPQARE